MIRRHMTNHLYFFKNNTDAKEKIQFRMFFIFCKNNISIII